MVKIRTFTERDRPELHALYGRAGAGSPSGSLWGHDESEAAIYLQPYMDLEPGSLFLAIEDGRVVGYLAGCLDSAAFPSEVTRVDQAIKRYRPFLRPRPARFFARSLADLAWATVRRAPTAGDFHDARWPAHLHINVLPEARGTGAADRLMDHWLERVSGHGVGGCHLQTVAENTRAVRFFKRRGFVEHGPAPVIPGLRYQGHRVHQRTMVWTP
ncbi:GNAT family N-acetyltransferase [Actinomadura miaoliensis]|uniref:N-acetyltransferase domain-containing protein n=1 Tax=Actinomadura miaoliensis TaxID=430685 RepID=A0ABP7VK90_9ACTN